MIQAHLHAPVQPPTHHLVSFLSERRRGRNSTESNSSAKTEVVSDGNETVVELPKEEEWQKKSKIVLSIINGLGLGFCGVDRCFMGQVAMGLLKAVTLSGFLVWGITDSIMILVNCIEKADRIDTLGYRALFFKDEIEPAFWLSITLGLLTLGVIVGVGTRVTSRDPSVGKDAPQPLHKIPN